MASRIQPETTPPTVIATTPANGATGVNVGEIATVTFSEPMKPEHDHVHDRSS